MEMEKLLQIGKEFGLEGEKLLEFVEKQQKLEDRQTEGRRGKKKGRRRKGRKTYTIRRRERRKT